MRIVLVGPELEENLSLRFLMGALAAQKHEVRIVRFESRDQIPRAAEQIAASGAQVAGFSMVFTRRAREFADLVARCRKQGFSGLTIAGGHFAAFHAARLLRDLPQLDAVAMGEGEDILCDIARGDKDLEQIAGLTLRRGDEIVETGPREAVQDLDSLPWAIHRRPFDRYMGLPLANMMGSRGCTHACAFCSIAAWHKLCGGARYRKRSVKDIAAEMGCLWREGVRVFNFHDDNFLERDRKENLRRVAALALELQRQGVGKMAFQIKARPDEVDPEVFSLLRSMGLFRVFLGIEAGTEWSLKKLGRGQTLEDNMRALQILGGLDLHVAYNLLLLNPDSTFEDFQGNVRFLGKHTGYPMNFCRTEIYAGTPLERRLRRRGGLLGDYWGLDYEITDQRAQLAFELFRDAFFDRNFGPHPLHYLSGQVEYEHQLRMDFFGTTDALRARAKGYVHAVNSNTVGYLEEVLDAVRDGCNMDAFKEQLFARVASDDVRLHRQGQQVLGLIRDIPPEARRRAEAPPRTRAPAQVALATALALSLASCGPRHVTNHMEAAPPPPEPPPDGGADALVDPDAALQPDLNTQVMEAAPYWEPPLPDAGVIGTQDPDAATDPAVDPPLDPAPDPSGIFQDAVPAGDTNFTAPVEAAPPPPPHHMEAAPPPPEAPPIDTDLDED